MSHTPQKLRRVVGELKVASGAESTADIPGVRRRCPHCGRGYVYLSRHILSSHPSAQPPTGGGPDPSTDVLGSFLPVLEKARHSLRLMRSIPQKCRKQVARELSRLLSLVVESGGDEDWCRLFSFAYLAFRLPPPGVRCKSAHQIVFSNLQDVRRDMSLATLLEARVAVGGEVRGRGRRRRASPAARSREAAQISFKIQEGSISAAAKLLCSTDVVVAGTPDVVSALEAKHPDGPSFFFLARFVGRVLNGD